MQFTSTVRLSARGKCFMSCAAKSDTGETAQCTEIPQKKKVLKNEGNAVTLLENHTWT